MTLALARTSFSNAALCALKLDRHELAEQCCDRGLRFASSDVARAKLLTRKAQALLDRPNPNPSPSPNPHPHPHPHPHPNPEQATSSCVAPTPGISTGCSRGQAS